MICLFKMLGHNHHGCTMEWQRCTLVKVENGLKDDGSECFVRNFASTVMPSPRCLAACYPHEKGWRIVLDERTDGPVRGGSQLRRLWQRLRRDTFSTSLFLFFSILILSSFLCCPPYLFLFPLYLPLLHFSLTLSIFQIFSLFFSFSQSLTIIFLFLSLISLSLFSFRFSSFVLHHHKTQHLPTYCRLTTSRTFIMVMQNEQTACVNAHDCRRQW